MGSTAADLDIEYSVDETKWIIEIETGYFDSALIEDFLLTLQRRQGINAIRDDREDFNPPRPPYRAFLTMSGQRYELETHLLPAIGGTTANTTVVLRRMG